MQMQMQDQKTNARCKVQGASTNAKKVEFVQKLLIREMPVNISAVRQM
jgi:hypothetical protein